MWSMDVKSKSNEKIIFSGEANLPFYEIINHIIHQNFLIWKWTTINPAPQPPWVIRKARRRI